jgi:DNA repair photolyase
MTDKRKTGTKEWGEVSKNLFIGCKHDCRYCYAREHALRVGLIKSPDEWPVMRRNKSLIGMGTKYLSGRIMFPTTHDIFPEHLDITIPALRTWLNAGNNILIVTKPHLDVIQRLCAALTDYKKQIVFRFTIGSADNESLVFWEPGAPTFEERHASLAYAFHEGFQTSVSCEPYLDHTIADLIYCVSPLVTDTIWIGTMNDIVNRVDNARFPEDGIHFLNTVLCFSLKGHVEYLYNRFKNNPKVRWKDSIKKMLGLAEEAVG